MAAHGTSAAFGSLCGQQQFDLARVAVGDDLVQTAEDGACRGVSFAAVFDRNAASARTMNPTPASRSAIPTTRLNSESFVAM